MNTSTKGEVETKDLQIHIGDYQFLKFLSGLPLRKAVYSDRPGLKPRIEEAYRMSRCAAMGLVAVEYYDYSQTLEVHLTSLGRAAVNNW